MEWKPPSWVGKGCSHNTRLSPIKGIIDEPPLKASATKPPLISLSAIQSPSISKDPAAEDVRSSISDINQYQPINNQSSISDINRSTRTGNSSSLCPYPDDEFFLLRILGFLFFSWPFKFYFDFQISLKGFLFEFFFPAIFSSFKFLICFYNFGVFRKFQARRAVF